jgi:acyl-CoA synthetase (NDP forming)
VILHFREVRRLVEPARREGRSILLEPEGLELLRGLGLDVPPYLYVPATGPLPTDGLAELRGDQVVVKVVSPEILHKAVVGGIRIVPNRERDVREAITSLGEVFGDNELRGFTIHSFVPYSPQLGSELLVGLRWTAEFGPALVCGLGGAHAELLVKAAGAGASPVIRSPVLTSGREIHGSVGRHLTGELVATLHGPGAPAWRQLLGVFEQLHSACRELLPDPLVEIEINPLVFHDGRWLALDVLARLASEGDRPSVEPAGKRPLDKVRRLLEPHSIAIVGVSRGENPGHVILRNVLEAGFDRDRLFVVKPEASSFEGCPAVGGLADLPEAVDLLIVALGAASAVEVVEEAIERSSAESLLVISGGLGEKEGTEGLAGRLRTAVRRARQTPERGPVINGPNCLGIRSRPGHYDSLFLPRHKLGAGPPGDSGVALLSQSGALLAAKLSRLPEIAFRYAISVGNQTDLTLGDYLTYLRDDPEVRLFAVYAEGFQPLDGLSFLSAAAEIRRRGGTVLLYRGGRAAAGVRAAASHTAAVAGDYAVARALAQSAGVVVADSLEEFEDLIQIFAWLPPPAGRGVAVVTNAGFESVGASDHLGQLELASLTQATCKALDSLLRKHQLEEVVTVANPLDLTPMAGDEAFEEAVRIVLADEGVDAALVGCVPLTPALETLAAGAEHSEDIQHEGSIAQRLVHLKERIAKPWIVAVDAGPAYEPMRELLRTAGVPTVEGIDRAARCLSAYCASPPPPSRTRAVRSLISALLSRFRE